MGGRGPTGGAGRVAQVPRFIRSDDPPAAPAVDLASSDGRGEAGSQGLMGGAVPPLCRGPPLGVLPALSAATVRGGAVRAPRPDGELPAVEAGPSRRHRSPLARPMID